jgi:myosin-5
LDLLDEESRLPTGSDKSLVSKLNTQLAVPSQKFYEKPRFGNNVFTIKHYAVAVTYTADGFIEKNKDTVSNEQQEVMMASTFGFLKDVLCSDQAEGVVSPATKGPEMTGAGTLGRGRGGATPKKPTLGSMFKQSLVQLMETIRMTESHVSFIICHASNTLP